MVQKVEDQEREYPLGLTVDRILDSYDAHGNINHLDGSNLPSRIEVSHLLDDLLSLVFPGFFSHDRLDKWSQRFFVVESCARSMQALEMAIVRALRVKRQQESDELESRC